MNSQNSHQELDYKETELGSLPTKWDIKKISAAYEVSKKPSNLKFSDNDEIVFISMENISDSDREPMYELKKYSTISSGIFVQKGDLILAKITPCFENGKQALLNNIPKNVAIATTEVIPLHPIDKTASTIQYLYYYLKFPEARQKLIEKMEGTTGRKRLPKSMLTNLTIPLPPLIEQQKMVFILSRIQCAKEKTDAVINSLKELKKSLMKHLFTYGAVGLKDADKVKLKETEIGLIPEKWEIKKIANLLEKTQQRDMRKTDIEFKYIDVSSIDRDLSTVRTHSFFRGKDSPSRARKIVKYNDVIVATVRPTLKRMALISKEYDGQICSTAFCVLRAMESLYPKYLFYIVQRDYFIQELGKIQKGANYPAVSDSEVKNQRIMFPSLEEQQEIANILFSVDMKICTEENRKHALDELFKSMIRDLMTAKIRAHYLEVS